MGVPLDAPVVEDFGKRRRRGDRAHASIARESKQRVERRAGVARTAATATALLFARPSARRHSRRQPTHRPPAPNPSRSPSTSNGVAWAPALPRCSSRARARPSTPTRRATRRAGSSRSRSRTPSRRSAISRSSTAKVRPGTYVGDDGSSDTSKDVSLKFDWAARKVTGTAEQKPVNATIQPGVQDSLSVQVALMCALAAGESPKSFQLIDKDEVKEYQYRHEGNATLDTPDRQAGDRDLHEPARRRESPDATVDRAEPGLSAGARGADAQRQARAAIDGARGRAQSAVAAQLCPSAWTPSPRPAECPLRQLPSTRAQDGPWSFWRTSTSTT